MKKQKPKTRKICRKKGQSEPEINQEHQKQINALANQFREDQLKIVLRRCYSNVQKYGPEAIMKAVDDSWTAMVASACHGVADSTAFLKFEQEVAEECVQETLEVDMHPQIGITHPHQETSKRNALFLIESSEGLVDYDSDTLVEMKQAYEKDRYDDVADLAYLYDRNRRPLPQPPERQKNDNTCKKPESPWRRISELLMEVAEEDQSKESPLKCCVEAVRHLSRDLTYDHRVAAKDAIRKAIKYLEDSSAPTIQNECMKTL